MPRIVRVELLLSDGHWYPLNLAEDSEQCRALLGALAARSRGASELSSQLLQVPLDGGRSALSFMTHDVVAITTRPPVLVLPEARSRETPAQKKPPLAALAAPLQHLDLRDITFYVINCKGDDRKREFMKAQLEEKGLRYAFVDGVKCTPHTVGIGVSHLKALMNPDLKVPFAVLDCQFMDSFRYEFDLPADADALYLGVSLFGIREPGKFSWAVWKGTRYVRYDASYFRVLNMLSRHAIVYLSHRFCRNAIEASIKALTNPPYPYPADIGYAMLHASHLVLTPVDPICYQSEKFKGNHTATKHSLKILAG